MSSDLLIFGLILSEKHLTQRRKEPCSIVESDTHTFTSAFYNDVIHCHHTKKQSKRTYMQPSNNDDLLIEATFCFLEDDQVMVRLHVHTHVHPLFEVHHLCFCLNVFHFLAVFYLLCQKYTKFYNLSTKHLYCYL